MRKPYAETKTCYLDVGAGLSGIGTGDHLQQNVRAKSHAILEGRDCIGSTWELFRYPGIRSDSDMFTLGIVTLRFGKVENGGMQ